jgi:hypothetical protein
MPELFELLKLFGLLGFAMQFVFDVHRRIRSVLPMRFVVRLQFV